MLTCHRRRRSLGLPDESVYSRSPSADPARQGRVATPSVKIKPDLDATMTEGGAAVARSQGKNATRFELRDTLTEHLALLVVCGSKFMLV